MGSMPAFAGAFLTACALVLLLRPVAQRIGLVDRPGGRKCHEGDVPLIGGLAVFLAFLTCAWSFEVTMPSLPAFVTASALLVLVGTVDDFLGIGPIPRFAVQIGAAWLMVTWGGTAVCDLGGLWHGERIILEESSAAFTVFATVGVINAMNMADGLDGLAGGLSVVSLALMAVVASTAGLAAETNVLVLLACSVAAFLVFNLRVPGRRRAVVFMGDAGSTFIGFALCWFAIRLSQGEQAAMSPVAALWILAIPLLDSVAVMLRRVLRRRSPFAADREHLHHLLTEAGYTVGQVVGIIVSTALLLGLSAIVLLHSGAHEDMLFATFIALFWSYFFATTRAGRSIKSNDGVREVPSGPVT